MLLFFLIRGEVRACVGSESVCVLVELQQSVHGGIPLRIALFTAFFALHPRSLINNYKISALFMAASAATDVVTFRGFRITAVYGSSSRGPLQIQIQISYSEFPVPSSAVVLVSVSVADPPSYGSVLFLFFFLVFVGF